MSRIGSPRTWSAVARQARLAAPAAATAALCFSAGGFFAGTTAVAAIAVLVALLLRITLARHPWEGWSAGLSVGAGALALFAVWTLVSSHWSGAPGRALLEFDRTLVYLAAFVISGLFAARAGDLAVVLRWTAAAVCGVCIVALATRLAPGTFPTDRPPSHTRLEFPLTYWNSLGALAAVGLVLALHVTSSIRQPAVARVLAAAAFPAVAVCLYFTFSRGGSIAAVFGVVVYLVLGYSRGFVPAFIAVVPTTAFALQRAFDADLLAGARFEQPVAAAQRGDLLTVVVACALAAALLRALLLVADLRLARIRLSPRGRLGATLVAASLVALLAAGAVAGGVPARVERERHALTAKAQPAGGDLRAHLTTWDDNSRYEHWRVALDEFKADPLHGSGAGTSSGPGSARGGVSSRSSTPTRSTSRSCPSWGGRGCSSSASRWRPRSSSRSSASADRSGTPTRPSSPPAGRCCSTRGSTGTGRCRRCSCGSSARAGWCWRAGVARPRRRLRG
jgi:hypothetical protein